MSRSSYEQGSAPSGEYIDDSYVSRPGHKGEAFGVISDREPVEAVDENPADTDAQLGKLMHAQYISAYIDYTFAS
jgi:hypothetical protein